jgi:non-ribosomal peptide synthetase component E (peptide arylation enzyme)
MAVFDPAYFRAQGWWRDETLCDWIDRCAVSAPDRAAILTADRTLTYRALRADVASLAAGLANAGIRRDDVVVVHLPNVPEFLIAWLVAPARACRRACAPFA